VGSSAPATEEALWPNVERPRGWENHCCNAVISCFGKFMKKEHFPTDWDISTVTILAALTRHSQIETINCKMDDTEFKICAPLKP
jgi:hypothetical protein